MKSDRETGRQEDRYRQDERQTVRQNRPESKCVAEGAINLVGHSFGGSLALFFTHRFPEKVKQLTLIAPGQVTLSRLTLG